MVSWAKSWICRGIMIQEDAFFAQLISGVMTEDGIKTASPVIVGNQHKGLLSFLRTKKNNNLPKEAKTLGSLLGKMPKYSSYRVTHKKNVQHGRLTYYKRLKDMLNLILHTHKESMVSFVYSNHHAKQSAQELFLSIIDYFLSKLEAQSDDFVERRFLFRLILGTFRRGELADLSLLGFDPVAPSAFDANNNLIDERAVDIVLSARSLLTRCLAFCLRKLRFEGTDDEQYAFCAHVMAISIFRLPKFGECIVQSILSEDDITNLYRNGKGRLGACNSKLSTIKRRASFSKNGETRGLTRNRSFLPGLHGDPTVLVLDWSPLAEFLATSKKEEILAQNKLLPTTATTPDAANR